MQINLTKTNYMIFRNGKAKKLEPLLFWGDDKIERAESYKYLGVEFKSNMNYGQICDYFLLKAKQAENQLFGFLVF